MGKVKEKMLMDEFDLAFPEMQTALFEGQDETG